MAAAPCPPEVAAALADGSAALDAPATAFLADLVSIPTVQPPGDLAGAADRVCELIAAQGFEPLPVPVPEPFVRQHGMASLTDILVRVPLGTGAGPVVALAAPLDTAPPGGGWTRDPFAAEVADGRLHGCGAADSKADAAAYLFALKALIAAGPVREGLSGAVELHFTFDDETGGYLGPQYLIAQGLVRPDRVIAAGATRAVGIAQGGCLHLDVVVRGRQAHAAHRASGRDALEAALPVLQALYDEQRRLEARPAPEPGGLRPSLTVATISGGSAANLVPDRVTLRIDRRITPEEEGETVERVLGALVGDAAAGLSGVEVECQRRLLAEPVVDMSRGSRLADIVAREAEAVLGEPVRRVATPVLSGARFYAEAGIPTATFGVGPVGADDAGAPYGPDESVSLADFAATRLAVARVLSVLLSP